jgi:hypothetical protein
MPDEIKEQAIIINPREQIQTLIDAGKVAKETVRYAKEKSGHTAIFIDEGNQVARPNPTLAEYLRRAEAAIIERRTKEIIEEAEKMIKDELTNIKELLK